MDLINWNTLLFAGKWAFIALVYLILIALVIAVRREMVSRSGLQSQQQPRPYGARRLQTGQNSPGSLRVLRAGSDPRLRPGLLLPLRPETSLGAEPENDLVINDRFISGRHARLRWDGAFWWLEDLGSTNGTTLDGRPCPPHVPHPVPPGARLALGAMEFEMLA